jgi:hypothetical protein
MARTRYFAQSARVDVFDGPRRIETITTNIHNPRPPFTLFPYVQYAVPPQGYGRKYPITYPHPYVNVRPFIDISRAPCQPVDGGAF